MTDADAGCRYLVQRGTYAPLAPCSNWSAPASTRLFGSGLALCHQHLDMVERTIIEVERSRLHREYQHRLESEQRTFEATFVYFLQRSDGMVKIGQTRQLRTRRRALENEHGPLTLIGLRYGGRPVEAEYHERFRRHRLGRTEFFQPAPPVLREASKCRVPAP